MPERLEDIAKRLEDCADDLRNPPHPKTIPFKRHAQNVSDEIKEIVRDLDEITKES